MLVTDLRGKIGYTRTIGRGNTSSPQTTNHRPRPAARETIDTKGENTMKELKFFVCTHCGNLAGMVYSSGVPMICCGEPMKELVPNTVDAAGEKHKPVVSVEGSTVTVAVGLGCPPHDRRPPDPVGGPADRAGRPAQGAGRQRRAQGRLCPGRRATSPWLPTLTATSTACGRPSCKATLPEGQTKDPSRAPRASGRLLCAPSLEGRRCKRPTGDPAHPPAAEVPPSGPAGHLPPLGEGRTGNLPKFIFTKIIQTRKASGNGRFLFVLSLRWARGPGRVFRLPLPRALWTPYPPATTRAEPWTQKQKVAPGVWLKKLFTARQKYCASLFPGAIRPALRFVCAPFGRACTQPGEPKRIDIQNHRINNPNIHFTLPPKVTKRKQKQKIVNRALTPGGYAIMPLKGKDLPFNLFWVCYLLYTIRRKKSL